MKLQLAVSLPSLISQIDFQMVLADKEGEIYLPRCGRSKIATTKQKYNLKKYEKNDHLNHPMLYPVFYFHIPIICIFFHKSLNVARYRLSSFHLHRDNFSVMSSH